MTLRHWAASLLAAAGFAMITVAPSHAQALSPDDPAWAELTCVYTALMDADDDAYFAVVDAYITEATEGDLFEQAATIIESATADCSSQHSWNADQEEVAITMGVAGTVADAVEGWFIDEGYSDEEIDAIIALIRGAADVDTDDAETIEIYTEPSQLESVRKALEGAGIKVDSAESAMVAKQTVGLDSARARQALRLVELLEELEDVQRVSANFDIPEDVFAEVAG